MVRSCCDSIFACFERMIKNSFHTKVQQFSHGTLIYRFFMCQLKAREVTIFNAYTHIVKIFVCRSTQKVATQQVRDTLERTKNKNIF